MQNIDNQYIDNRSTLSSTWRLALGTTSTALNVVGTTLNIVNNSLGVADDMVESAAIITKVKMEGAVNDALLQAKMDDHDRSLRLAEFKKRKSTKKSKDSFEDQLSNL